MPTTCNKTVSKIDADVLSTYLDAGITLVPNAGHSKNPGVTKGFQNAPFDADLAFEDRNYTALLNEKYLVIDVDKRSFKPGDKPFSRLCETLHLEPAAVRATFCVRTPSGGLHLYFTKHPDVQCRGALPDFPGLEFKTKWIMAAGSYSPEHDKRYTILAGSPLNVAPAPDVLLALLTRPEKIDIVAEGLHLDHSVNISRFIDYLNHTEPAVQGKNGEPRTFQVACMAKDFAISKGKCLELMLEHFNPRCLPPWEEDHLREKIEHAYEYSQSPLGVKSVENEFDAVPAPVKIVWNKTKGGQMRPTLGNTVLWLNALSDSLLRGRLKFNLFSNQIEVADDAPWMREKGPWTDSDAILIKDHLSRQKYFDIPVHTIHEAAHVIASQKSYHPVKDYLNSLQWDGAPRLDNWLVKYCNAKPSAFTRFVGRKTLVAAVNRVYDPGCKFDHVLILEGAQGIGKSLACRVLGQPWFTDAALDLRGQGQGAVEVIQGSWIIELAEMDILNRAEKRALKAFITRQHDRMRPAYGRVTKNYPRQCVFIGTINPEVEGYFSDTTGNRRFWPVTVHQVNIPALLANRDQLWAEAISAYRRGETLYVDSRKMDELARAEIDKRTLGDPWHPILERWLDDHYFEYYIDKEHCAAILPSDIYTHALGGSSTSFGHREHLRIATILKLLGWSKRRARHGGPHKSFYIKPVDMVL